MPTWLRNPTGALLLVVLLVSMAGIASLADKIGHPFGGYASTLFFLPLSAPGGIVVQETPAWWTIRGINPPLDEYTYLLEINDQPYQSADVGAVFERALSWWTGHGGGTWRRLKCLSSASILSTFWN